MDVRTLYRIADDLRRAVKEPRLGEETRRLLLQSRQKILDAARREGPPMPRATRELLAEVCRIRGKGERPTEFMLDRRRPEDAVGEAVSVLLEGVRPGDFLRIGPVSPVVFVGPSFFPEPFVVAAGPPREGAVRLYGATNGQERLIPRPAESPKQGRHVWLLGLFWSGAPL